MNLTASSTPTIPQLTDRLAGHRTVGGAPRTELEWLAAHGTFVHYEADEVVLRSQEPVDTMAIQLSGRTRLMLDRGSGMRYLLETGAGDVSGLLPFSRVRTAVGDIRVDEAADMILVHRDSFPEMIRLCPTVIEALVHSMLDRSRMYAATTLQDDKMIAMGRLAAGLAHELNNPASAAARSARLLNEAMRESREAWRRLCAAGLSDDERAQVERLVERSLIPITTGVFSALERSDREDEVTGWLEAHGADHAPAATLADSGVTTDLLDELAEHHSGSTLDVVLRWVAADYTAHSLTTDVQRAAVRIHDLVSAVKRFSYLDRAAATEPTSIVQGLVDTVAVLAAKARAKAVAVRMDVPADLPSLVAHGSELNQVWANLIENAIDAVDRDGEVRVVARREDDAITVSVADDGPGVPPELQGRIFDPFFTTKPIGEGTGLGLDIVMSVVRYHDGTIMLDSRPGRTEFRVTLPLGTTTGPSDAARSAPR